MSFHFRIDKNKKASYGEWTAPQKLDTQLSKVHFLWQRQTILSDQNITVFESPWLLAASLTSASVRPSVSDDLACRDLYDATIASTTQYSTGTRHPVRSDVGWIMYCEFILPTKQ